MKNRPWPWVFGLASAHRGGPGSGVWGSSVMGACGVRGRFVYLSAKTPEKSSDMMKMCHKAKLVGETAWT